MKFGKLLSKTSDDMPEMHELFLRYKLLKKQLKAIPNKEAAEQASAPAGGQDANNTANTEFGTLSAGEQEFIKTLNEDLNRFNQFFIDKEEDSVIRLQLFADQLQAMTEQEQLQQLKSALVHFHGEMVLMLHWSLLNYAAVVKILKKHDKCTGLLLRAPYLSNVLQQPFYSTSIMSRLVKRAEDLAQQSLTALPQRKMDGAAPATSSAEASTIMPDEQLLQLQHQSQLLAKLQASAAHIQEAAAEVSEAEDLLAATNCLAAQNTEVAMFRKTRMALETWATLGRTASTPSTVLPANASGSVSNSGCHPSATAGGGCGADTPGTSHATASAADGRASRQQGSDQSSHGAKPEQPATEPWSQPDDQSSHEGVSRGGDEPSSLRGSKRQHECLEGSREAQGERRWGGRVKCDGGAGVQQDSCET